MTEVAVTQVAGLLGAALGGAAYVPQIWHLVAQRCSAGLSRVAFAVWLTSSLLVTSHAIATQDAVFIALGVVQVSATSLILVFATRFAHARCDSHRELPAALPTPPPAGDEHPAATSQSVG